MESEDLDIVNEPPFPYGIIRKASFESLEEENRLYSLSLSPIERLHYMHELTLNAYGTQTAFITEIANIIYKR